MDSPKRRCQKLSQMSLDLLGPRKKEKYQELNGKKFNRWTVLDGSSSDKILCKCECGTIRSVRKYAIINGHSLSCGCLQKENAAKSCISRTRHGKHKHPIYVCWTHMKERCFTKTCKSYKNYGGRGISVCEEWLDFETFYRWAKSNGWQKGLSIERKDNDGNYCPENCTWIPKNQQTKNTRKNVKIEIDGKVLNLSEWARRFGISLGAIYYRVNHKGWPIEKAIITPKTERNRNFAKLILYKNKTLSIVEWSRELGINKNTLYYRISNNWPLEKVFKLESQ